jgi:alkanesulfonate monooxygenase SsuD/methylene tetrahydromethanopterin reductase-like flavin-dependent oxidoreductase (luciferase family)
MRAPLKRVTATMRDRPRFGSRHVGCRYGTAGEAGRDAHEITYVDNMEIHVGRALGRPGIVSGTAEEVAEQLAGFARLGFTAMNLIPWGSDVNEQRELLARDVIPAVRA